ncbi:MAG: class I SAM-dependent methyltransferase [Planctomycetota bacterium]|jgi:ubiquinone/menaquinone biosynthesis C-methylase UbiE/PAS domain-containing protein
MKTPQISARSVIFAVFFVLGIAFCIAFLVMCCYKVGAAKDLWPVVAAGLLCLIVPAVPHLASSLEGVGIGNLSVKFRNSLPPDYEVTQRTRIRRKTMDMRLERERRAHAEKVQVPGADAPQFDAVSSLPSLELLPGMDPMVPTYVLDKDYRIVDWNDAFSLAFDHTIEGRRGESILEWVYFLDNYEQVLEHGSKAFADPQNLPFLDEEEIEYTSDFYGKITAKKLAIQMFDHQGECGGWYLTYKLSFADDEMTSRYVSDLTAMLRMDMVWNEYSYSYDKVIVVSDTYKRLINTILGKDKRILNIHPIPRGAKILDLGAGTGTLCLALVQDTEMSPLVFALEKNQIMMNILKHKCEAFMKGTRERPSIVPIKQDITTLHGLPDNYFDVAIMNNVLYSLEQPESCLQEVCRVLKPNGDVRISGPMKTSSLNKLFKHIKDDLRRRGDLSKLQQDFDRVEYINKCLLASKLFRWDVADVEAMLRRSGFSGIVDSTDKAYAKQAMAVCARK